MSSLVITTQPQLLDKETACLFLKLGMFSRNNPLFSGFFQQLKQLKLASEVILFISQIINSMREKIRELFGQIEIQISEEQLPSYETVKMDLLELFNKIGLSPEG